MGLSTVFLRPKMTPPRRLRQGSRNTLDCNLERAPLSLECNCCGYRNRRPNGFPQTGFRRLDH